jgi:hypothetical protein
VLLSQFVDHPFFTATLHKPLRFSKTLSQGDGDQRLIERRQASGIQRWLPSDTMTYDGARIVTHTQSSPDHS